MKVFTAKIITVKKISAAMRTYTLEIPEGVSWEPGSHMRVGVDGCWDGHKVDYALSRPLSISTRTKDGVLEFSTKIDENPSLFKSLLSQKEAGDTLTIMDITNHVHLPFGVPIVLLTMGVGMSSMHALIAEYLETEGVTPIISLNVAKPDEHLMTQALVGNPRVKYEWKSNRYAFQQAVARLLAKPDLVEAACFVVVGSDAFIRSTIESLLDAGVAKEHILLDKSAAQRRSYLPAS